VSVERGDIDPFGYPEDDEPTGIFNPPIPSSTAIDFKNIVRQVYMLSFQACSKS
jgi:hypothetical protein